MSMMNTREMEIALASGQTLRFRFPVQVTDENAAERIEEALKLPTLSIRAGDKLYVIPTASIQMITISPAPKKLPRTVIRGATLVTNP
jgi:hypothetical protein